MGGRVHYERRRPETPSSISWFKNTPLETFAAQVELDTGSGLLEFVKEAFGAFLASTALPQARQMSLQPFLHKKRRLPRSALSTSRALASMRRCAAPP